MKLKNKKTGETAEGKIYDDELIVKYSDGEIERYSIGSLKDLEKWEDYEEPKDYYIINLWGEVCVEGGKYQRPGLSELGLTFGTKEEAEKAVEKLKAWKRLKDNGFEFEGYSNDGHGKIFIKTNLHTTEIGVFNDYDKGTLDLLFSGEDD